MRAVLAAIVGLVALIPVTAHAQHESDATAAVKAASSHVELVAGGGAEGFFGTLMRQRAGMGVAWRVAAVFGNPKSVRVETAYIGSRQTLADGGNITGNGLEGVIRINIVPELRFQPFFLAGAGWMRYSATGAGASMLHARVDHVLEMPIGAGVGYRTGALVLDVRAYVRVITSPDLVRDPDSMGSEHGAMMHRLGMMISVGYSI